MKKLNQTEMLLTLLTLLFVAGYAFAGDSVTAPGDFLNDVVKSFQAFGGLGWAGKISIIVTLVLSSMKVSFLNDWIWSRLGAFKVWAAPVLSLLIGVFAVQPFSLAGVVAYAFAGAGAVYVHELLDTLKAVPWLGPIWKSIIALIERNLGGPASKAAEV